MTYLSTGCESRGENASCFIFLSFFFFFVLPLTLFPSSCLHFLLPRLPLFVPSTLTGGCSCLLQLRAALKRSRPRQSCLGCALQLLNSHSSLLSSALFLSVLHQSLHLLPSSWRSCYCDQNGRRATLNRPKKREKELVLTTKLKRMKRNNEDDFWRFRSLSSSRREKREKFFVKLTETDW